MQSASRLKALRSYEILDTPPEKEFDELVRAAADVCDAPIATVSFCDDRRQWFKARHGLDSAEVLVDAAFFNQVMRDAELVVVNDTKLDPRFAHHAMVVRAPHVRFYAGAALRTEDGHCLGALSVFGPEPRELSERQRNLLGVLARQVMTRLELRRQCRQARVAEVRANEAVERLERILDRSADVICVVDADLKFQLVSAAVGDLWGYPPGELIGRSWLDLLHPEDRDSARAVSARMRALGETRNHANRVLRKDGRSIWMEWSATWHASEGAFYLVGRDDTLRRVIDERMRLLELCLSRSNDIVVILESPVGAPGNPRVVYVNDTFTRLTGYDRDEAIGRTHRLLHGPHTPAEEIRRIDWALKHAESVRAEIINYTKDGREFWVEADLVPVADLLGRSNHWIAIERDITQRKTAELAMQQLQATLRAAQRLARIGSWYVEMPERRLVWTETACEVLGLGTDAGHDTLERFYSSVHGEDRARVAAAFEGALSVASPLQVELRLLRADGEERLVRFVAGPETHSADGRALLAGTLQDITEARRSEAALRESEEQYRLFFEQSPQPMWVYDEQSLALIEVNESALRTYGYERDEFLNRTLFDLSAPADAETLRAGHGRAAADDHQHRRHWRHRRKDGAEFPIELITHEINFRGEPARLALALDRTDQVHAQDALTRSEERFRLLARATSDAMWDWDLNEQTWWWSEGFQTLFGYDEQERAGGPESWMTRIHADDGPRVLSGIDSAIKGDVNTWADQYRFRRKDGAYASIENRAYLIRDHQGRAIRVVGGMTDTTKQKSLEAQYLRAQRLESIGRLAGGIAHDLNNVLAPIMMSAGMLRDVAQTDEERINIDVIEKAAQRGADLVKQVLLFARGWTGEQMNVDPRTLVDEITSLARETFPRTISVRASRPADLWTVRADPTQLHQALLNLAVNARDAMPEGGILSLTVENVLVNADSPLRALGLNPGRFVIFSVADSGVGMSVEVRQRIFEPFYTTKEFGRGTGLGLATALGIVRGHQGAIDFVTDVGKGTCFRVYLPAGDSEEVTVNGPLSDDLPRGEGETILLVEDEEAIRLTFQRMLEDSGYRIIVAEHGAAAISQFALKRNEIRVIVTDFLMPVMDGNTFLRALRAIDKKVPVVVMTGTELPSPNEEHLRGVAFLRKPFPASELIRALGKILEPLRRPTPRDSSTPWTT